MERDCTSERLNPGCFLDIVIRCLREWWRLVHLISLLPVVLCYLIILSIGRGTYRIVSHPCRVLPYYIVRSLPAMAWTLVNPITDPETT
jgi:hypothetical protein